MGHSPISFAIIGGGMMVAEVDKIADHTLVEVSKVVVSKRISIELHGVGASFEQRPDLVAFETMVVIRIVKAGRQWRWNSG